MTTTPFGILAEAKFSTYSGSVQAGTVYEVFEVEEYPEYLIMYFFDDKLNVQSFTYFLNPKEAQYNQDLFQLYFQF